MGLSEKLIQIKSEISALLTYANTKTGGSDETLGDAVYTLVEGYGQVGGSEVIDAMIAKSITEISSNIQTVGTSAFIDCNLLKTVNFPFATELKGGSFQNCYALTSLDGFPLVETTGYQTFAYCKGLTDANLPSLKTVGNSTFITCSALKTVNLPLATSIGSSAFYGCGLLQTVNIPLATSIGGSAFYNCSMLKSLDFHNNISFGNYVFRNCSGLTSLILRGTTTVCTYSSSSYDPSNAKLKIYVPRDLLESYKVATNWSRLASKFVALEDYTVDGTTTGAMNRDSNGNIVVRT